MRKKKKKFFSAQLLDFFRLSLPLFSNLEAVLLSFHYKACFVSQGYTLPLSACKKAGFTFHCLQQHASHMTIS